MEAILSIDTEFKLVILICNISLEHTTQIESIEGSLAIIRL